jgi:D-alanine-D-alanine ligase
MIERSSDARPPLPARVLVFAPYLEEDGGLVSPHYDPPEYRAEIGAWLEHLGLEWEWVPITARNLDAEVARARTLAAADGGAIVFNICDGTASDRFPGIEVIAALDANGVPYTGASEHFYRVTTSKAASKTLFKAAGVPTAPWVLARTDEDVRRAAATLPFPLFVKPDVSAGSYGIQIDSVTHDLAALTHQFSAVRAGLHGQIFEDDAVLIETFVEGREFTVLVVEDSREPLGLFVLAPGERVFDTRVPPSERFLAYERYWGEPDAERPIPDLPRDPYYRYELAPPDLSSALADLARRAFRAVNGAGYARVDIRLDERSGELLVLEVNAQCGLSASDSSTVGSLLNLSGQAMPPVIERILRHGMHRRLFVPVFIAHAEQDGRLVSPEYEDARVREEIDGWMRTLNCEWEWVAISNSTLQAAIEKVAHLSRQRRTVVLNLCDGDDINGYPGLSVVRALEAAHVPFTGARSRFYEISTSKRATKQRFADCGVRTTPFVAIRRGKADIGLAGETLGWPLFLKPDMAAGSSGITEFSRANNLEEGLRAVEMAFAHMDGYESWVGGLIAEPFLAGREFTVLVVSDPVAPAGMHAFVPVERVFGATTPVDERFLTSDRVMSEGDDSEAYSYAPAPDELRDELVDLARRAMQAVEGSGYARVDIRYDLATPLASGAADPGVPSSALHATAGKPYVLEVNANCGITADPSSAVGSILHHSDVSIDAFIVTIMADALRQHARLESREPDRMFHS